MTLLKTFTSAPPPPPPPCLKKKCLYVAVPSKQSTSADVSLTSVQEHFLSWINYDKESRKKALEYTSGYLELKYCSKQFLTDSAKVHIDTFQSNPEFNRRVTHILQPRQLTVVVIGGVLKRGGGVDFNRKCWKLGSETQFVDITEILGDVLLRGPSICYYDMRKLILTGGHYTGFCVMLDMSTKKWKKLNHLKGTGT